jgi:2-C-methyl-D-erythritol 4-phosphate cytidylyltransferase
MKKYAVIVAGGLGKRMNNDTPKQFLLIKKKPVLSYTVETFLKAYDDVEIILVLPEEHIAKGQEIVDGYFDNSRIQLITGGRTRFHSVKNGLSLVTEESIIFVHDGVRCLLTTDLIHRCYEAAETFGTAIPVINCRDSVRIVNEDDNEALDRTTIKLVQTPQTFHSKILLEAYKIDYKDKFTDEASVVEAFGLKVNLVEGEENNIKITGPMDLMLAERILENDLG